MIQFFGVNEVVEPVPVVTELNLSIEADNKIEVTIEPVEIELQIQVCDE